jgi:hypothetical protein
MIERFKISFNLLFNSEFNGSNLEIRILSNWNNLVLFPNFIHFYRFPK